MKSLALASGDLVVGVGGYQTLTGAPRIRQDLALAMGEAYGHDTMHPEYGSVLASYIGQPLTAELELLVRSEVIRVLQQYVASQQTDIAADALSGSRSRYSYQDLVDQVVSVDTQVSFDTLKVLVALRTRAGESVNVARTVTL